MIKKQKKYLLISEPPTPNITAHGISPYEVFVSLDNRNRNLFNQYQMELVSKEGTSVELTPFTSGDGNHTFSGLEPETTYTVRVRVRKDTEHHCQIGGGPVEGQTTAKTR